MGRKKSDLSRLSRCARAMRRKIARRTEEEREIIKERNRQRVAKRRAEETPEQRAARLEEARLRVRRLRASASELVRLQRKERDRVRVAERRQRERAKKFYAFVTGDNSNLNHFGHFSRMTEMCPHCKTLKYIGDTTETCCILGKIELFQFEEPEEQLKPWLNQSTSYLTPENPTSALIAAEIVKFNEET